MTAPTPWHRESVYTEGFAHANPVPAAAKKGPFLFSGVITGREAGTRRIPPTVDEQTALVFQHIREVVTAGGGTIDDIVQVTFWIADLGDREALNREWTAMFPDPTQRPTRHALAGQLETGKLIECDFVAVLS
jgi:enamine deaminase RidA (YjgF/YER057c/UK114 family)